jgi:hypothetical protein
MVISRVVSPAISRASSRAALPLMDATSWLDLPAAQPGGVLAVQAKGALGEFDVVLDRLVSGESGAHRYDVSGKAHFVLQAKIATDAFKPVLVLLGPNGVRWDLTRAASSPRGGVELPDHGTYTVVVTCRENIAAARAICDGEYRLTLMCDAPGPAVGPRTNSIPTAPQVPPAAPSSRSGRFGAWESEPR